MKTTLSCFAFITLATVAAGLVTGPGGRIVGGTDAQDGEFPEVVSVLTRPVVGTRKHVCGGIIINDNHVLTTASCVIEYGSLGVQVMGAGTNLDGTSGYEEFKNIKEIFIHPNFDNDTLDNDLAVMRTSHNFVFVSGLVSPAELPPIGTPEPALDTMVTIGGWGRDQYEGTLQKQMQKVNMTYLPHADCVIIFGSNIEANHGCVGGDVGKGVCEGDEGSAVFTGDHWLVGIVAWQVGCEAYPAAVTLLAPYYDWITSMFEA